MAKKIQAWVAYGPRIILGDPMTKEEIIENIVLATNQSKGSVLAVLAELDVQIEAGLKSGRIVHLPNGTHFTKRLPRLSASEAFFNWFNGGFNWFKTDFNWFNDAVKPV